MYSLFPNLNFYPIFILLLILFGAYVVQLVPCSLQRALNNNIYLKHFIYFLTLLFLVNLTDPDQSNQNINELFSRTIIIYIFFIFIIKTHYKFFIAILIIIALLFLLHIKKNEIEKNIIKEHNIKSKEKYHKMIEYIVIIRNFLLVLMFILIIIGFLIYMGEKKYQYKNKFNYLVFIFGKPDCNNYIDKLSFTNSLKYTFK